MRAWRSYIVGSALLRQQLHSELSDRHNVALGDYELLVLVSECADHRMRMAELAAGIGGSKSRVSHQVARMEKSGLLRRTTCPGDGRGVFAELTDAGLAKLVEAAPTHVEGVRAHLVDLLDEQELATLAAVFGRMLDHLDRHGTAH
ncbi:MarR family transcriptional regulator [Tamaricihabitans halophyticus]|uniref:MarR family transcriptional regulator n=2 Tax=Tamaricihabitans halophyticus TaxID=1262583 RepID=A0A4R2R5H2_9PSEU|nr:MarR family transcriptional regulator [Tamaricihabitans halophyticus]